MKSAPQATSASKGMLTPVKQELTQQQVKLSALIATLAISVHREAHSLASVLEATTPH